MASSFHEDDLDEEMARRSIVVSNIPVDLTVKDLIIHFQRERNGGGEVDVEATDGCRLPCRLDPSAVVVVFDEPETVETAIQGNHCIKGFPVSVDRYPIAPLIPEVFHKVKARLNPDIFRFIDESFLRVLQEEFGVECNSANYLVGSWKQISLCHDHIFERIRAAQQNSRRASHDVEPTDTTSRRRRSSSRSEQLEVVVYETVPVVWKFIQSVPKYREMLSQIEIDNNVQIRGRHDDSKVEIKPLPDSTRKKFDEGCEGYIKIYRTILDSAMFSKEIVLTPGPRSSWSVKQAIADVKPYVPVIIQPATARDTWMFYGEEEEVKNAAKDICKMLNIDNPLMKKTSRKHAETSSPNPNTYPNTSMGDLKGSNLRNKPGVSSSRDSLGRMDSMLEEVFVTKKGFRLSVCLSDITEEHVDAIVNCTDEYFDSSAGLAYWIAQQGGHQIQKEAIDQTKRRKLRPGDIVMTNAGDLPCKKVMHIITWKGDRGKASQKNIVQDSCFDCLMKCQSRNIKSIALPAVGTGKPGMALDNCAVAMINAVEEYMRKCDPKKNAVADIRFVHVDSKAFEVFKIELEKRYGDCKIKPSVDVKYPPTHSGMNDDESLARRPGDEREVKLDIGHKTEEEDCPICLDHLTDPVTLSKCKHKFCKGCIDQAFKAKKKCPTCGETYGIQTGNMPPGTMKVRKDSYPTLPGHKEHGIIVINYNFYGGIQGPEHPNPGRSYSGTSRTAYLPDSPEGQEVLGLLRKAFDARLTFTIGTSVTTGLTDTVTWNDIHHKTNIYGGPTGFGYPDLGYLKRVKEELAAKGIS